MVTRSLTSFSLSAVAVSAAALSSSLAAEGAEEAGGLPQFDTSTYASQVFWLLITFFGLYFLCARLFLPRLGGIIEERRNRIADDFDQAAESRRQADEAEVAYKQALADAKARAAQIAAETRTKIDADIAEMKAETEATLAAEIDAAEARIRETGEKAAAAITDAARETTKDLVAALIDETPSDDQVSDALARVSG